MNNTYLGIAGILLTILLIFKYTQPRIEGHWMGEYVVDNLQDTLDIDPQIIHLSFEQGAYFFESTLKHREEGAYIRKGDEIIIEANNSPPFKMIIKDLTPDHLKLSMNEGSSERILSLRRSN